MLTSTASTTRLVARSGVAACEMGAASIGLTTGRLTAPIALPLRLYDAAKSMSTDADELPSFSRGLFSGRLESGAIHPYPRVLAPEIEEILEASIDPVTRFFDEVNDASANDDSATVPQEVTDGLKELGAFGLQVPEELGGIGMTNTGYARLVEIVGANDLGVGIYLGAHQSIGFKGITLFGTPEQKEKYLPDLAAGEKIAAFVLTEPSSGSDANSIRTRATLSEDGKHWILNGAKLWISNGGIADVFTVFAQTGESQSRITAFIVERGFGGVTNGPPERKMGIKCSNTAEVTFEDTMIPVENVLGEVGGGFKVAMEILNNGRFGMGAALTGTMKFCIKGAVGHASQRLQFGDYLSNFGSIQDKIAEMTMRCYATESLAYMVAGNMDRGAKDYQLEAAISKIFASESAWWVADETIQIHGGLGFMREYPYERILRDLRIFRIFEGTNDILRLFVALTGIQDAAKGLKPVQEALKNPISNVGVLLPEVVSMARAKMGMPSKPELSWVPSSLSASGAQIETVTAEFGVGVKNLLMEHGKHIIHQQQVLWRVADVVIDTTAMGAVVARAAKALEEGSATADQEVAIANAFCATAARRAQANIAGFSGAVTKDDALKVEVAKSTIAGAGYTPTHPLGF